jgi:xanthine dehydrogenase accessory factor
MGEGRRVAAAVLVEALGSSPLDPGAVMLVDADGTIEGSVTGGCVEGALFEEAQEVLGGGPPRLRTYGISDEAAAGVGLTCGGTVRVFVHELTAAVRSPFEAAVAGAEQGRPTAIATLIDGPAAGAKLAVVDGEATGTLGSTPLLDQSVARDARGFAEQGVSTVRRYGADGAVAGSELRVYIQSFAPPPSMVIFGAVDFAIALARHAGELGYRVTICDARAAFAANPRLAEVAEVVVGWPQDHLAERRLTERDAVLVFSHDPKFDEPALLAALRTEAGYIGAMGSRRTQTERAERLRAAGVTDEELARIAGPCGLDIGARTPEETAISVLAEIIASRTARAGAPLSTTAGSIRGSETATAP